MQNKRSSHLSEALKEASRIQTTVVQHHPPERNVGQDVGICVQLLDPVNKRLGVHNIRRVNPGKQAQCLAGFCATTHMSCSWDGMRHRCMALQRIMGKRPRIRKKYIHIMQKTSSGRSQHFVMSSACIVHNLECQMGRTVNG